MQKFFFLVLFTIVGSQVWGQSYQRWITWVSPENHEVTVEEMAEIVSLLYENKVIANKALILKSGTILKISKPSIYLKYVEKAVKAANQNILNKDDLILSLSDAEKFRWGNDITGSYKNYYFSEKHKEVRSIDNFKGEGKDVEFIFVRGIPVIKCDCGNPIENQNPTVEEGGAPTTQTEKPKEVVVYNIINNNFNGGGLNLPDMENPRTNIKAKKPFFKRKGVIWAICGIGAGIVVGTVVLLSGGGGSSGGPGGSPTTP